MANIHYLSRIKPLSRAVTLALLASAALAAGRAEAGDIYITEPDLVYENGG